jgi:hypothetical protein
MKLFIIQTGFGTYATNGNDSNEVTEKFRKEYNCEFDDDVELDIISIKEIKVEELDSINNNEDIIFF